jgi:hypothetical protein
MADNSENLLVNGSFEQALVNPGSWQNFSSVAGWTALPGGQIEIWRGGGGRGGSDGRRAVA